MTLAGRSALAPARQGAEQRLDQEEWGLHIKVHHLVPTALGKGLDLSAPGGARVVDENVELGFPGEIETGKGPRARRARCVRRHRDAFAEHRETPGRLLAGRGLAGGNIDLRASPDVALRDHLADAARTTGDEGDAPFERKQVLHGKRASLLGKIDLGGRRTSRERAEDALDRHSPMTAGVTEKSAARSDIRRMTARLAEDLTRS